MSIKLSESLQALIKQKGWKDLTEVQKLAYEPITSGYNVMIIAPTGYGKTEAAMLPIFDQMIRLRPKPVSVLYITPLKALINDLAVRIGWWAERLGLEVGRKHGEVSQAEKNRRLRRVPDILITTIEGLEIDLDWAERFREFLKNVRWVVVDEVHDIVGTKRGSQLSLLLERLKEFSGTDFQRIGLSATVGDVNSVMKFLAGSSQRPTKLVRLLDPKKLNLTYRLVKSSDVWKEVSYYVKETHEPPTLLFTNSRYATERLYESLEQTGLDGIYLHHSSISKEEKAKVEEALRQGKSRIVVCTRTLELGIDVGEISKVFMFRPPPNVMSLLQRLGRSGHTIGSVSRGEILCTSEHEVLEAYGLIRLALRGEVEKPRIFPHLDVLARGITALALQKNRVSVDDVVKIVKGSYVFRNVSEEVIIEILKTLHRNGVIKLEGNQVTLGKAFFKIWRFDKNPSIPWLKSFQEFFSFINTDETFVAVNDGRPVGEIDSPYVYRHLRPGDIIRIAGRIWKIKNIDQYKLRIEVEKYNGSQGEIPLWKGDVIPKSPLLVKELKNMIKNRELPSELKEFAEWLEKNNVKISRFIVVEKYNDEYIYSTIISEKVSNTIAQVLLLLATNKYGTGVAARASIYGFSVKGVQEDLFSELLRMNDRELRRLIIKAVMMSPFFVSTLREVAPSFGKVGKITKEDKVIVKEALRQTVLKYFSIKGTLNFVQKVRNSTIKAFRIEGPLSPLAKIVLSQAYIRPWIAGYTQRIYEELKQVALTVNELSNYVGLPPDYIENKLKRMRKPGIPFRVVNFIDVETRETRWVALESFEKIVKSPEFSTSFTPYNTDETYIVSVKPAMDNASATEFVITVKDLSNIDSVIARIPFSEVAELRVKDPSDPYLSQNGPKYYSIPRSVVPYLILNAITYYQTLKYE
mgnify:FL=1